MGMKILLTAVSVCDKGSVKDVGEFMAPGFRFLFLILFFVSGTAQADESRAFSVDGRAYSMTVLDPTESGEPVDFFRRIFKPHAYLRGQLRDCATVIDVTGDTAQDVNYYGGFCRVEYKEQATRIMICGNTQTERSAQKLPGRTTPMTVDNLAVFVVQSCFAD